MPRRALVVGINSYDSFGKLNGCVADAEAMGKLLQRNQDGSPNYECRILLDSMENGKPITRVKLREVCQKLFSSDFRGDILFYFSGHGYLSSFLGGYLCSSDATKDDWGVPMEEIVNMASHSQASDILIILDCCHSGDIANPALLKSGNNSNPLAVLREDMTVLAASRDTQVSIESGGRGLFTSAICDALEGGAADHMGWVTAASVYSYVERRFGSWDQRPIYKSYATKVTVLRQCAPLIERIKLYKLLELFPEQTYQYPLDPEHEPEDENGNLHEPVNHEKVAIAKLFKEYRDSGLLKASIPGEQLYWTARRSHTVELTARGREYWWLIKNHKI
ncbi:caspase family protein [Mastigocladopsis repens]|uniref:caspase family protein n=1 Tax=Mastigocladopsis repens TaxID=221287 RepID=UPI00035CD9F5|nr:caspase family protein [Mastigocladopsis repens]